MGVVARYFERLFAIVGRKRVAPPAVSADASGLQIGSERLAWSDVRRLDAFKRDIYAGELLCLAILDSRDRLFEINEESPGWKDTCEAIEDLLPGSVPHTEWLLRLMAAGPGEAVTVFPVAGSA